MALLEIIQYPNKLLRRKARYIIDVNLPKIQQDIANMLETVWHYRQNCAALAATQLAIEQPYNIIVINPVAEYPQLFSEQPLALLNPKLIKSAETELATEGCMSIAPDCVTAKVRRAREVTVTALDHQGQPLQFTAKGFLARCLQHECDHLVGKLYIDYLSAKEFKAVERAIINQTNKLN